MEDNQEGNQMVEGFGFIFIVLVICNFINLLLQKLQ